MEIKLPFGLREGKLIHISEIRDGERGLKCNCYCPCCNTPLQARIGEIRQRYFAHSNIKCEYALETALHIFAKEILEKHKKIKLPKVVANYKNLSEVISDEIFITFDKVDLEKRIDDIIPDVILEKNGSCLLVEVRVTHKVDEEKLNKIKKLKVSTLEIDLGVINIQNAQFDKDLVEDIIINGIDYKYWLFNNKIYEKNNELKTRYKQMIKDEEEKIRKQQFKKQRQEKDRLERIRKLMESNKEIILANDELKKDPTWIEANKFINLDINYIPAYLNKKIDGERVFNCDRRIWQVRLFKSFIYGTISRSRSKYLKVEFIIEWLKRKPYPLPLNWDLVFLRDIEGYHDHPDLDDVIGEFLLHLCNYGFLRVCDSTTISQNNQYYWWFERLEDDLKVLPTEFRKQNYTEYGDKMIDKDSGEIIGELADLYKKVVRKKSGIKYS